MLKYKTPLRHCVGACGAVRRTWKKDWECGNCLRERLADPVESIHDYLRRTRGVGVLDPDLQKRVDDAE
jgi:hypothetical protein